MISNKSPSETCISKKDSDCNNCSLQSHLDCHFNVKKLLRFASSFFFIVFVGGLGLFFNGFFLELTIFLLILLIYGIIFFEFWEIRILCSHCPFYAEKGRFLRCYGNYGSFKAWKYHPEPISKSEKYQLIIGFVLLFLIVSIPLIFFVIYQLFYWIIAFSLGFVIFLFIIKKYHCARCFNFSCLFNSKPKEVVDEFLKHNPVMRKAWEDSGWKIID
jgi:hypothetical protein